LLRALAQLNTNLHSIVGDIRNNFNDILAATGQLASGNRDLSARTDSQAAALEETAASMEELTSAVKQNADNSRNGDQYAANALRTAEKGGAIVGNVVSTIAEISESSNKIADIVGIINGIAYQTNLLALNAAVEAARAGEAGRGFAVVATEVRSLAQRSAAAATDIRQLIEESVAKVNHGTVLANDAGSAMQDILAAVGQMTGLMADIANASNEQSTGIGQVNDAVMQMDEVTQQNAAQVEETSHATDSLQQRSTKLRQALDVFKLGRHDAAGAAVQSMRTNTSRRAVRRAA
jgi:methyl-accepting chemotaxis protein